MKEILSIDTATSNFVADYYQSEIEGNYGVLVLGGSEGGKPNHLAEKIAKLGYSVLALAYFKYKNELPQELQRIPLEYIDEARKWLVSRDEVRKDGVIVVGWSKGAELALVLATDNPDNYKGVIAISPSSAVWPGIINNWSQQPSSSWTKEGKELSFISYKYPRNYKGIVADIYKESLLYTDNNESGFIAMQKLTAPLLLLSGSLDTIWPSDLMSEDMVRKIDKVKQECYHYNYPLAGHLLDERFALGGAKEENKKANEDAIEKMKDFLQKCNSK